MEIGLNILHYCIYSIHYKLHLLADKVNPFWLVAELPFLKRRYEKLGIDIHKEVNKAFSDKRNGMSMMAAGGVLFGILFLFLMGVCHLLIQIMNLDIVFTVPYFIVFTLISFIVCYFYVFKNDKYLQYFKEFEKRPKAKKNQYTYLSIGFIIGVLCLFIGSFMF